MDRLKLAFCIIFFLIVPFFASAMSNQRLSDQTRVSLLTCGPGKEIYTKFGHTGIRFLDKVNDIDIVFHWGIFMFDNPGFVFRFMLGKIDYQMGPFYMSDFYNEYKRRGSYLIEQPMNLSQSQKQMLWDTLWTDFFSEKKYYKYNFISANCATKACDAIVHLYDDTISFDYKIDKLSYRDIINRYIDKNSWFNTGINLIIGSSADTLLLASATASFPPYTKQFIENSYIIKSGKKYPIVGSERELLKQTQEYRTPRYWYWLQIMIPILIICAQIVCFVRYRRYIPIITPAILWIYGAIGFIICFLWFFSYHPIVDNNYNLLWLNPLLIAVSISLHFKKSHAVRLWLTYISLSLTALYAVSIIFSLQYFSINIVLWWLLSLSTLTSILFTFTRRSPQK